MHTVKIAKSVRLYQWRESRRFCYNDTVMPFLRDLMTKVQTIGSAGADFFAALARAKIGDKLCEFVRGAARKLTERIPEEKRRLFLTGICGVFAVLLLVCVTAALVMQKPAAASPGGSVSLQSGVIPPEEMFLPEEPDFIPGVLLERERRAAWTAEDAAAYWQDPLKNGEEPWRKRVEAAVDELLERVP